MTYNARWGAGLLFLAAAASPASAQWTTVGGNAQHTGLQAVAAQPLNRIK